jgi:hypothetical protein
MACVKGKGAAFDGLAAQFALAPASSLFEHVNTAVQM